MAGRRAAFFAFGETRVKWPPSHTHARGWVARKARGTELVSLGGGQHATAAGRESSGARKWTPTVSNPEACKARWDLVEGIREIVVGSA